MDPEVYRSLIGNLIYLIKIHPNISYAVDSLARYMDRPEETHLQAAKPVLRYLKSIMHYGLLLSAHTSDQYHSHTDADSGRDVTHAH